MGLLASVVAPHLARLRAGFWPFPGRVPRGGRGRRSVAGRHGDVAGTGCWPSVATIASKANISDRTVRRVVARLEADGHVIVHRGGGRAGS